MRASSAARGGDPAKPAGADHPLMGSRPLVVWRRTVRRMTMKSILCSLLALALGATSAVAQDHQASGEHHHSEAELGSVHFANSCRPEVQADLQRGIALLHSFGYEMARDAFG